MTSSLLSRNEIVIGKQKLVVKKKMKWLQRETVNAQVTVPANRQVIIFDLIM